MSPGPQLLYSAHSLISIPMSSKYKNRPSPWSCRQIDQNRVNRLSDQLILSYLFVASDKFCPDGTNQEYKGSLPKSQPIHDNVLFVLHCIWLCQMRSTSPLNVQM